MERTLILAALGGAILAAPVLYTRLHDDVVLPAMENPRIPGTDAILVDALARSCQLSEAKARALALGQDCDGEGCLPEDERTLDCVDQTLIRELRQTDPLVGMWAMEAAISRGTEIAPDASALALDKRAPSAAQARALVVLAWTLPREEAIPELRKALDSDSELALAAALELGRLRAVEAEPDLIALEARLERPADQALVAYSRALITESAKTGSPTSGI